MKKTNLLLSAAVLAMASSAAAQPVQSWEAPYRGADATGPDVIGLWQFDGDSPGKDVSGHGHNLTLRGKDTQFVKNGKFGGALQIEEKVEPDDTRQGAAARDADELTPKGAFTIEMWISPDETLAGRATAFLLDKKNYHYASDRPNANHDYLLLLRKSGNDKFTVEAQLGFGKDSATARSMPQQFVAGQWYHVAFSYDGKGGAIFTLNGARIGESQLKDRGAVSNGAYDLIIGDRVGSIGARFPGRIDEVRLSSKAVRIVSGRVLLDNLGSRTAFYRMEKDARLQVRVFNDTLEPLKNGVVHLQAKGVFDRRLPLPATLESGASTRLELPVETALRPGSYTVTATVENAQRQAVGQGTAFPLVIVPRPLPHRMPVVMWAGATSNYKELADLGFTGELVSLADYKRIWENEGEGTSVSEDRANALRQSLDQMLAAQIGGMATLTPGRVADDLHPEFNRTNRDGKVVENTDGLYPRIQQFSYDTGAAVARTFGDMPGWQGALLHSEVRDHAVPSFNEIDKKAYREYSGGEIPSQVSSPRGVPYAALPDFPASRIVPDEHPILKYYRWYWKTGDGWNKLNTELDRGLKSTGRKDIFTWFDPAVRTPSVWGSGGNVDFINQWTYTYPNPLKMGLAADELFAMAKGRPGQKVMNMTQIIWYREQTTKTPVKGKEAEWEKVSPEAKFISIAPDHLSEAMWLNLARPVQAIAYHGWGSLGDKLGFSQGSYVTTNVNTRRRLAELVHNVVQPLGPALLQVPDAPADVAFLESFASQMLAGRGTYGWGNGWGTDSYIIAHYAGLQPEIVYDETIQQKGLDQYKVLFLTDCDVLTQSVANAIQKFQQRGGIIVGDENLAPGIQPDILLTSAKRGKPDETKALWLKKAAELRRELDVFYQHAVDSSNPEVVTRRRHFGGSDYVFTVNDHRTYGDYVGQHGLVMEKGLPSQSNITLNRKTGYVYDLMKRQPVAAKSTHGRLQFPVNLGAGEGNVFLVSDKPVGKLWVTVPATAQRGRVLPLKTQLNDDAGAPFAAVVPLTVTIRDPQGRTAEKSGYYGAANGRLEINLDIAPNDAPGQWQVTVREGLSGQSVSRKFVVK